jgi:hypothetical protein
LRRSLDFQRLTSIPGREGQLPAKNVRRVARHSPMLG